MSKTQIPTGGIADDAVENTKLDLTFDYALSGTITGDNNNLVPLSTITTNNSAVGNFTFDNVFDSTYESYRILGYVAPDTSGNPLQFEWRTGSSGSNATYTSTNYNWIHFGARIDNGDGTGSDIAGDYSDSKAKISAHTVQSDASSSYTAFDMTLTDPRAVFMSRCNWYGVTTYQNASSHRHFNGTFGGSMNADANATGITFSYTGVNIKYGRITIYGIKHD